MAAFTDSQGRSWPVAVSILTVEQVQQELEIDLYEVITGDLLKRLAQRPLLAVDILWIALRQHAQVQQITRDEFLSGLGGDVLEQAMEAFFRSLADFFPKVHRAALHGVMDKERQLTQRAGAAHQEMLASGQVEQAMEQRIEAHRQHVARELAKFAASSGSLPESSASIPAP